MPALAGSQNANYLLGVLAYEQAEVRIYPARYELVIGGTPVGTHNVASTAGRHNLGICAKGALSGEVSGVWLDGAQIFNGVGLWTQTPPRALFTTRTADPTGLTQVNGVVLLDFFAYIKSFLRTVDDSDLTMGSGTFGGIGSGNGVTPPAMPRTTLCVPDGPAACTVYELALDGSGNTTGAPAMDEQGDSTRQTTWRPFLTEPATLLHVVNGSRDSAATLAPGYGEEGGSVGPLAINVPDAVDEAHWYVKPVASLPGHTPATSGGAGLPHAPLYVCSGFNRKHGTGDDRTTAPPDAYPLPVASAPGGGDPGSSDGESKASTGPCACSLGNPSVANAASTTDEGTGATKSPAGHWTDPVPAVQWGDGPSLVHEGTDVNGKVVKTYRVRATRNGVIEDEPIYANPNREEEADHDEAVGNKLSRASCGDSSAAGGKSNVIATSLVYLLVDALGIASAIALVSIPEPSTLTKWAAGFLFTASVGDMIVRLGRITNALNGDEVVSETTLSQLETLSAIFAAAGGLFALPQAADDFVRALSSFKNRAGADKAAAGAGQGAQPKPASAAAANGNAAPDTPPTIHAGKQGKHVPGHNNFEPGKSELTHANPQQLIDKFAGRGKQAGNACRGEPDFRELVDFEEIIGVYVDPVTQARIPTTMGTIRYAKDGTVHIVPARPKS